MLGNQPKDRIDALGASLLIGFSGLLGLNQALVKLVNAGFAPMFQAGLRSFCALFVILLWAKLTRLSFNFRDGNLTWSSVAGVLFALEFGLLFVALEFTTVSRVSLFFYTMPLFTAVAAHFLYDERLTPIRLLGLAIALTGIGLALAEGTGSTDLARTWPGDLMALAGAASWAGITVVTRSKLMGSSAEQILLIQLMVSAFLLLAAAPFFGELVREPTLAIVGIFSFQVVAIASLGFLLWLQILRIYPVSNMASFSLLAPLFGIFFGWLIFDDPLTPRFLLALALVCVGLVAINRR